MLMTSALAILLAAAANFVIDPYGLYRYIDREGFNHRKPKAPVTGYLVKPYVVERVRPKTLLLGSSRVEMAVDPESPAWPAAAHPVYNMALPASALYEAVRSLQHVLSVNRPETVVLGLDFFSFLVVKPENHAPQAAPREPTEFEKRLLVNADGSRNSLYQMQRARDFASALFSLDALANSGLTVALQKNGDQPNATALGFNTMQEYPSFVRRDGHHTMFRQVAGGYLTNYMRSWKSIYYPGTATSREFELLRRMVGLCRANGTRLLLYVHPNHAHVLESYRIAGLWPAFEEWKRALVKLVAEETAAHPAGAPIELWDFGGYDDITSEPVPKVRGRAMQWYWEAGHYKREVGDFVVARMLAKDSRGGTAPSGFGVRLNAQNVEQRLLETRKAQLAYAQDRREEIAALEEIARTIGEKTARQKSVAR
jgi:hypothetical protein